nr:hypothetical protein GCM10020241_06910 [Streptoalloteichus tenebrarius]
MTSTARTRTLGARLGRLRKAAGLTVYDAAEHLRCTSGKISKIENGHVGVKHQELLALLDLYKVTGAGARTAGVSLGTTRGRLLVDALLVATLRRLQRLPLP